MLQVRKNEISLRNNSGGSAQLRTLEGTLVTRESARFDSNDSESKSQIRLSFLLSLSQANFLPRRKLKFFKDTYCQKHSVIFPMSNENQCISRRHLQTTKWKNLNEL